MCGLHTVQSWRVMWLSETESAHLKCIEALLPSVFFLSLSLSFFLNHSSFDFKLVFCCCIAFSIAHCTNIRCFVITIFARLCPSRFLQRTGYAVNVRIAWFYVFVSFAIETLSIRMLAPLNVPATTIRMDTQAHTKFLFAIMLCFWIVQLHLERKKTHLHTQTYPDFIK